MEYCVKTNQINHLSIGSCVELVQINRPRHGILPQMRWKKSLSVKFCANSPSQPWNTVKNYANQASIHRMLCENRVNWTFRPWRTVSNAMQVMRLSIEYCANFVHPPMKYCADFVRMNHPSHEILCQNKIKSNAHSWSTVSNTMKIKSFSIDYCANWPSKP